MSFSFEVDVRTLGALFVDACRVLIGLLVVEKLVLRSGTSTRILQWVPEGMKLTSA